MENKENLYAQALLFALANNLKTAKQKKVYGRLAKENKLLVDEIVSEISKDKKVNSLYQTWLELKDEVLSFYDGNGYARHSFSEETEFRHIKNLVLKTALEINNIQLEIQNQNEKQIINGIIRNQFLRLLKEVGRIIEEDYEKKENYIRSHANIAQNAEEQYLEMLMNLKTDQQKQDVKKIKVELQRIEKRLSEVSAVIKRLYEDLALGRISEERYDDMYYGLNEEEKELKNKQKTLQKELDKTSEVFQNVEKFIPLIRKYTDIQELNAYILNELIERIVVHEKTIGDDGKKTQKVEIYYKFVGVVEIEEGSIKEADR